MISVCYLLRIRNGPSGVKDLNDFENFITSYEVHPAGTSHELNILIKGPASFEKLDYIRIRAPASAKIVYLNDVGFDLGSYTEMAISYAAPLVFFTNQHTIIEKDNWLAIFERAKTASCSRVIGATASYSSLSDPQCRKFGSKRWIHLVRRLLYAVLYREFPKYKNPHLRTNSILVETKVWCEYFRGKDFRTKKSCYLAESGPYSFTKFLLESNYRFAVVRADGSYKIDIESWADFVPFRNPFQSRFLILSDNQTRLFSRATPENKMDLYSESWR